MKNFTLRLLTGIVYVATITFCVIYNSFTFLALFLIITFFCLKEFYQLINIHKETKINPYVHGAGGALMFLSTFLLTSYTAGRSVLSLYLLYIVGVIVYELYAGEKKTIVRLASVFLGQVYIALPLSLLNLLAFPSLKVPFPPVAAPCGYQWIWIIALLAFIWANDTGAYLVGVRFGKHRLWERISPKKSWEGFFGGLACAIISAFIFSHFFPQTAWYHWVGLSISVVIFSTYGDLFESLIKRTVEVKDSGHSLPGHGGFLDRFDSLLFAVYAVVFYMQAFALGS